MEPDEVPRHKIVLVGDQSVGKTSIITRFMYDSFSTEYHATIGIDFLSKTLFCKNEQTIKLQLWDTGQERFRSLIPSYLREAAAGIVVYDITSESSFASVPRWISDIRNERGEDALVFLCGNKVDLADQRKISYEQGSELAKEYRCLFAETSAERNLNIKDMFFNLAEKLPTEVTNGDVDSLNVKASTTPAKSSGCKCL